MIVESSRLGLRTSINHEGFRNLREPSMKEIKLRVANDLEICVEKVRDVNLVLAFGFELVLKDTFYVLSFRINLIYVSCLDNLGFNFTCSDRKINMMLNSQIIGYEFLVDGLYKLSLDLNNILSSLVVKNYVAKRFKVE